jgi:hypothetical protein
MAYSPIGYRALAFGTTLGVAIATHLFPAAPAFAQHNCASPNPVPPATTTRTVQLSQFGVQVTIPANFRTMARQDGSVSILDPYEFNHIQCLNQGLPVLGTELETEDFRLLANPEQLSALEYAKNIENDDRPAWYSASDTICIQTIDGVEVVIREVSDGYDVAYAWYQLPNTATLVEISSFSKAELVDLVSRLQFMETPSSQI